MNVVDSSGWVEYVVDEENADFFERSVLESENLIVPTVCIYEVFKRFLREFGEERALEVTGLMSQGKVIDLTREIAIDAARISCEYKLAMADSIILATAQAHKATLWTQDEHFKGMEGVKYIEKK
jgi:toxin FitB